MSRYIYEQCETTSISAGNAMKGLIVEHSGAAVPSMKLDMSFSKQSATRVEGVQLSSDWLSRVTASSEQFAPLFNGLDQIRLATEQWKRTSPAPSEEALTEARALLGRLQANNLVPQRIMPSADGGIGICFDNGEKYADFECTNDGRITGIISNRNGLVKAFAVDSSFEGETQAIAKVREFLRA